MATDCRSKVFITNTGNRGWSFLLRGFSYQTRGSRRSGNCSHSRRRFRGNPPFCSSWIGSLRVSVERTRHPAWSTASGAVFPVLSSLASGHGTTSKDSSSARACSDEPRGPWRQPSCSARRCPTSQQNSIRASMSFCSSWDHPGQAPQSVIKLHSLHGWSARRFRSVMGGNIFSQTSRRLISRRLKRGSLRRMHMPMFP